MPTAIPHTASVAPPPLHPTGTINETIAPRALRPNLQRILVPASQIRVAEIIFGTNDRTPAASPTPALRLTAAGRDNRAADPSIIRRCRVPLILGVTGSIATGKSLVCETLVDLGAHHCDADKLVHRLYDPGTPGFDRVVAEFGEDVVGPDGYIDRKVLGAKVFGNPEAMRRLTRAMGDITGAIEGEIHRWRETLPHDASAVMEAVNLIEPGYARLCDQVWLVAAEPQVARARLIARNNFSPEEADQRLKSQRPWQDRAPAADFVIHNNGDIDAVHHAVTAEFRRVQTLYLAGTLPPSNMQTWWASRSNA
jgi:dephospho-CoA kinase